MLSMIKNIFLILLPALFLTKVSTQLTIQGIPLSQIKNLQPSTYSHQQYAATNSIQPTLYSQQQQPMLSNTMSTNTMPIVDKLNVIANAIQEMPGEPSRMNKRNQMAEVLRQTAIESVIAAVNACKCNSVAERTPLSMTQTYARQWQ